MVKIRLGLPAIDIQAKMEIASDDTRKALERIAQLEESLAQLRPRKSQLKQDADMYGQLE
jgi:hypothetical protein